MRTAAHRPEILTAIVGHLRATLRAGSVSPLLKQLIAVRIGQIRQCDPFLVEHMAQARRLGAKAEQIEAMRALAGFLGATSPGRPLLMALAEFDRAEGTVAAVVRELEARAAEGRGTGPLLVTAERTDEDEDEGAARSDRGSWRRGRRRRGAGGEPVGAASFNADELRLDPLEPETCAALLATVPGVGVLGPAEVAAVIRAAEGWPGRLVRIARSVAGPQRPLFPPLSEPREQAARSLEARPR